MRPQDQMFVKLNESINRNNKYFDAKKSPLSKYIKFKCSGYNRLALLGEENETTLIFHVAFCENCQIRANQSWMN